MENPFFYPVAALLLTAGVCVQSCSKVSDDLPHGSRAAALTQAVAVSDIQRIGGVDLADANPLNAGTYFINDSIPFYQVVMFNKVQINERPGLNVSLGWGSGMQKVVDDPATYLRPLQAQGIKVLLTISGNPVNGWGLANMYPRHIETITDELVAFAAAYGFDGIEVEDEWTSYGANNCPQPNSYSFSSFLTTLRSKLPADKLIHLKDTGRTFDLTPEAVACIDCAWSSYYSSYTPQSHLPNLSKQKWAPLLYDCKVYADAYDVELDVSSMIADGFGSIVFNRLTQESPLELFQAFATAAYGEGAVVTQKGGSYSKER